ncbi:DUF6303 family protein [Streptomyces sp. NPDC001984]
MTGGPMMVAGVVWDPDEGEWRLQTPRQDLSGLSPIAASWPDLAGPPTLLQRYDALAALGLAVVRGGPEAWEWTEGTTDDGAVLLAAVTEVRPLRAEELPAEPVSG